MQSQNISFAAVRKFTIAYSSAAQALIKSFISLHEIKTLTKTNVVSLDEFNGHGSETIIYFTHRIINILLIFQENDKANNMREVERI